MDNSSFTCSYSGCQKHVSSFHLRFSSGQKFRLNGSRLCSEACFRAQFLLLAEYLLKEEFQKSSIDRRQKLGLLLLEARIITPDQLDKVIESQKAGQEGRRVGDVIQEMGYATEQQITYLLSRQEGLPWLDTDVEQLPADTLTRVPPEVAVTSLVAPLEYNVILNELSVISASPVDRLSVAALEKMGQCKVNVFISPESKVRRAIARYYAAPLETREARSSIRREAEDLERLVAGVLVFYRRTLATNLEAVRCRELIWMRASNADGKYDWFVLLEPFSEVPIQWRRKKDASDLEPHNGSR